MSWKTLPEAEESLKKVYSNTYKDSIWWPTLAAITRSETTEEALDKLAKFKFSEINTIKEGSGQTEAVEIELMDVIVELKAHQHIFRPLSSFEDLMNPPDELGVLISTWAHLAAQMDLRTMDLRLDHGLVD